MEWLSTDNLIYTFETAHGKDKFKEKLTNNLSLDYEMLMKKTLETLNDSLIEFHYDKKVKQCKDNKKSSTLREHGNRVFVSASQKNPETLEKALELYTKSIAFAIPGSEEISLSFANRSAVLLRLNRWQECLDDIERALEANNYPEKLQSKIYARMAECYSKLAEESYIDAKFWLEKVSSWNRVAMTGTLQDYPSTKESDHIVNEENEIPELKSRNEKYSCASDALDIKYSKGFGRHYVATRDINVGEVLIVEKPYMQYLSQEKLYTHCSYCMTFMMTGIACDKCVNSVYCSRECKENAWVAYHKKECTLFDLLKQYNLESGPYNYSDERVVPFPEGAYLRLLLLMCHEAGGLQQLKDRVTAMFGNNVDTVQWNIKNKCFQIGCLESVLCLTTGDELMKKESWPRKIAEILRMLFLLLTISDFFNVQYDQSLVYDKEVVSLMISNPNILFVGKLLLKLSNLVSITVATMEYQPAGIRLEKKMEIVRGITLSSFNSLIAHSCFPNVSVQFKRNHIVIYSNLPIKQGEQIHLSLYKDFTLTPKAERQKFLQDNYGITCNCAACIDDWPPVSNSDPTTYCEKRSKVMMSPRAKQAMDSFFKIRDKVIFERSLKDKEDMLKQLCGGIEVMCEEYGVNSIDANLFGSILGIIYSMTGNTSLIQSEFITK